MLAILVYLILAISAIALFAGPWLVTIAYSLNGLMQPEYIWPWTFPEVAVSKYLAIMAIMGFLFACLTKKIDFNIYKNKQSFALILMWALMYLSDFLSPYPVYFSSVSAEVVLSTMNSILIMHFITLGLVSNEKSYRKALLGLAIMFAGITIYYVYWANSLYLENRWDMFHNGRLIGPPGSPYSDQNVLATLVVMGMPFIMVGYFYLKSTWLKLGCLLVIPLLWHALFLFGSRGSLLAVAACTVLIVFILKKYTKEKILIEKFKHIGVFKLLILIGFAGALLIQGGTLLNRSSSTVSQANSESEAPLNPRLVSWGVGLKIIKEYPLLGAGPQRFLMSSRTLFPGESVHVAHNTFLNFSANCGLPMGLLFLYLFWFNIKNYKYCKDNHIEDDHLLDYLNTACSCSLIGFFICAIFLDLIVFEAFYFILMLNLAKLHAFKRHITLPQEEMSSNLNISK